MIRFSYIRTTHIEIKVTKIDMRKTIMTLLLCLCCMASMAADLKLVSGCVECLRNEKYLTAEIDCSETVWGKGKTFDAYLAKARRDRGWEEKSMEYFYEWFNDEVTTITASKETKDVNYKVVVKVKNVDNGGKITADVLLVNVSTGETVATFYFKGSDGDAKDHITMRDPMKEVGECFGKAVHKYLLKGKIAMKKSSVMEEWR